MTPAQNTLVQDMKTNPNSYYIDIRYSPLCLIDKISEDGVRIFSSELSLLFNSLPKNISGPIVDSQYHFCWK